MTNTTNARICVGAIAGSFGVKGEVRLKSFCADPHAIETYSPLTDESGATVYSVKINRPVKGGFAARMSGITSKEQADTLKGTQLFASRDQLPDLPDDEYYHTDLVGLDVYDTGGEKLGTVRDVLNHGASDLLEIHAPGLKAPALLPFTNASVPTVDMAAGRIVADPPLGVFDDGDTND